MADIAGLLDWYEVRLRAMMREMEADDTAVLSAYRDPELQKRLEDNGYKLYLEKFSPEVLGKELLTILNGYKK